MNRFTNQKKDSKIHSGLMPVFGFLIAASILYFGANNLDHITSKNEMSSLRQALTRATVHCYAIEGFYPPSLEYLEEHYGFTYQEDKYFIDYQCFAQNIMPDIVIIEKGGTK